MAKDEKIVGGRIRRAWTLHPDITQRRNYVLRNTIKKWTQNRIEEEWRFSTTGAITKIFLNKPDETFKDKIMKLKKPQMRKNIGLLTGYCNVNSYLNRIGIRDDTDCDHCGLSEDTYQHFLCRCTAFNAQRKEMLGKETIQYSDIIKSDSNRILEFVSATNRIIMLSNN